jgi:hypothetical protein
MWTTGESVLYVFLYYAVLMAIGALMPQTGIGSFGAVQIQTMTMVYVVNVKSLRMTVSVGGMMHATTVPAVMIEPVEPIVYAQTGPWWGEPDRQD